MSHGPRSAADPVAVEPSVIVPVGSVLDRRSRRLPVSILIVLGLVAVAFAVGLHFGGAPSSETAALAATSPQPTPSAGPSTASTSPSVASGAPFASPPRWSDFVRTFDATKVIEALPGGATCVGGSPGSWIAPETSSNPDDTFVKTWLTSCPIALAQRDAFLSQVLEAIAPVDNPIRDGAGGVMAVTPYEEGGFVGSVALTTRASVDGLEITVTLEERPAPIDGPTISGLSPGSGFWTATGSMITPRSGHTATLLPSGKVLVAGGESGNVAMASAELFDPGTGTWTATGSMVTPRLGHTATLLPNGKVLVAGGATPGLGALASAELYDPSSGTWAAAGNMSVARADATATLLGDGMVLVAGGYDNTLTNDTHHSPEILATAEIYDPSNGTWTATGSMFWARRDHTATLLLSGKVLVVGGVSNADPAAGDRGPEPIGTAEVYDPATGTWGPGGSMGAGFSDQGATLLPDGRVLVEYGDVAFVALYDPASGSWTSVAFPDLGGFVTATRLRDGTVLTTFADRDVELYDPATGSWAYTNTGSITFGAGATATLLHDGTVLVAGGDANTAGVYHPGSPP
jgi:WD40 repeat protein